MIHAQSLIQAKLRPPSLTQDLVPRPRLLQLLNTGLARKLSLVNAPAGFGKTTLLCEWVQQAICPVAWVTFDQDDDDLQSFLKYFIAAINSVYPHSCEQTQSLLNAPTLPVTPTLVAFLANEMAAISGELILVLDDYHTLQQMAIHNLMERLIVYLPPSFHLVLGTRSSPPLSLVTLRAQGHLCELRQSALRFTPQEISAFFAQRQELLLDEEMLTELSQRTEGWPAALRLILLSMVGHDNLHSTSSSLGTSFNASLASSFTLGDSNIMSFLTEEVLSHQSPASAHFLLHTAIVERFSLSLYSFLAPDRTSSVENEATLAQCLRDNLFIVALGEGWYRYHPLFRELLMRQQERVIGRAGLAGLHRLASGWLEQNGLVSEAIRHALQAGEGELAVAVLNRYRIEAMNQEQWSRLEHWLALFPASLRNAHPILIATQAWLFDSSEMDAAQRTAMKQLAQQLAKVEASPEAVPELMQDPALYRMLQGELDALECDIAFVTGDLQPLITLGHRSLELLPRHHSHARAYAYIFLSAGYQYTGNFAQAEATLQRAADEAPFHNDTFGGRIAIPRFVFAFLGLKIKGAETIAQEFKRSAQQSGYLDSLCWANYYLGRAAYVENRLEQAKGYFEEVMALRHAVRYTPAIDTFLTLALIHQTQGAPEAALQMADEVADSLRNLGDREPQPQILALRAQLALLQGRLDEAIVWAQGADQSANFVPDAVSQIVPFTRVLVLLAQGSPASLAEVSDMLPAMQQSARMSGSLLHLTQLLVYQALLHDRLGQRPAAYSALEEALTLAQPSSALRLFADLGIESDRRLLALLRDLDAKSQSYNFARHLLATLDPSALPPARTVPASSIQALPPPTKAPAQEFVEALSVRELEVLVLIDQGMANKQIAQQLVISNKTVENHITNIYAKLNVHNRLQALRRAAELGLLPAR